MGKRFVKNRFPNAFVTIVQYPNYSFHCIKNVFEGCGKRPYIMMNSKGKSENEAWDNLTNHLKWLESMSSDEVKEFRISNTKRLRDKGIITLEEANKLLNEGIT